MPDSGLVSEMIDFGVYHFGQLIHILADIVAVTIENMKALRI
jgi:hypothetical protein